MVTSIRHSPSKLPLLGFVLAFVDLGYKWGSDPLNAIKLCFLGFFAVLAIGELVYSPDTYSRIKKNRALKIAILLLTAFLIAFLAAFLFSPLRVVALLGETNRNLGFLNYFFLGILGLYAALKVSFTNVKYLYFTGISLATVLGIYGILQHRGIDFIHWVNKYNSLILFTGNPDFSSSLLAILATLTFSTLFLNYSKSKKLSLVVLLLLLLLEIYWTQARQGLIGLALGFSFMLVVVLFQRNRIYALSFGFFSLLGLFLSILGTLQIGPLTHLLYKGSINDRGYNWRAAFNMFTSHPVFGVGVDHYGGYFFQYQSSKYPLISGYLQNVNNAHKVFLELFATAGVFVGAAYLCWIIFVAYRGFVVMKNSRGELQIIASGIISAWLVYLAQSFISVDAQVLSVWGWVLSGCIIGISIYSPKVTEAVEGKEPQMRKNLVKNSFKHGSFLMIRIFTTLALMIPLLFITFAVSRNETNTLRFTAVPPPTTQASRDEYLNQAQRIFNQPLLNPNYKLNVVIALAKNNYAAETLQDLQSIIQEDPRNANALSIMSIVLENLKRTSEAILYRKKIIEIYPYNAENLLALENDYLIAGDKVAAINIQGSIIKMAPGTDVAKTAANLIRK